MKLQSNKSSSIKLGESRKDKTIFNILSSTNNSAKYTVTNTIRMSVFRMLWMNIRNITRIDITKI